MNIYFGHSTDMDFKNAIYFPIRNSALNQEHHFVFPHEKTKEPFDTKEYLKQCDLFIAEVSSKSTGLGIELGWAHFMHVPIVCVYQKGTSYSSSLTTVTSTFLDYEDESDFLQKIQSIIKKMGDNDCV